MVNLSRLVKKEKVWRMLQPRGLLFTIAHNVVWKKNFQCHVNKKLKYVQSSVPVGGKIKTTH